MAKTAAQRQAEYRTRRNDGEGDIRLNMWVSGKAARALGRIAGHHGVTRANSLSGLSWKRNTKSRNSYQTILTLRNGAITSIFGAVIFHKVDRYAVTTALRDALGDHQKKH